MNYPGDRPPLARACHVSRDLLRSVDEVLIDRDVVEGRKDPVRVYAEKAEDAA